MKSGFLMPSYGEGCAKNGGWTDIALKGITNFVKKGVKCGFVGCKMKTDGL